jgi:hypothetical protein
MTTNDRLQNALKQLQHAPLEQVEVIDLPDGGIEIHFMPVKKQNHDKSKKGKWAKVAEELSREAPLTGIGEEFLKHTKGFRKGLILRNPFSETE